MTWKREHCEDRIYDLRNAEDINVFALAIRHGLTANDLKRGAHRIRKK